MEITSHLTKKFNPSIETLAARYLEYRNRVVLFETRKEKSEKDIEAIAFCKDKLNEIEAALFPPKSCNKKVFAAWQLLHRVSEEMILLMPREELSAYGHRLSLETKMSPLPDSQKDDWGIKIAEAIKKTSQADCSDHEFQIARHLFKNIHRTVNSIADDSFWDLWSSKMIALFYTIILIGFSFLFLYLLFLNGCLTITKILLLGAMGGLISGIITGERETLPKGHFWAPTTYYIFVRPTMGALAALITFMMLESQFLVKIVPPLDYEVTGFSCIMSSKISPPIIQAPSVPAESAAQQADHKGKGAGSAVDLSMVTLTARDGKQIYLYMLLLLFAGFSGDKLLKTIADRVTAKLIAKADKTKEAK